uniref:Uncharacterized protein n=1 Tax=Solanum tuberosum TaxID=4113 RepID=M1DZ98_SOLTU
MKNIRPENRLNHWASRRMALVLPNVPMCQALKVNIKSVIERSSRRVAEQFRDTMPYCPKLQDLMYAKGKSKNVIQMTKGGITKWIGDPDQLRRLNHRRTLFDKNKYLIQFLA